MSLEEITRVKKLVTVSATFTPVIIAREEMVKDGKNLRSKLIQVPYIWYSITFRKKSVPVLALFDSGSEVNTIYPTFAKELGLPIRLTNVEAQKIDGITLIFLE